MYLYALEPLFFTAVWIVIFFFLFNNMILSIHSSSSRPTKIGINKIEYFKNALFNGGPTPRE